jgi:hypothetical protein
MHFDFASSIKAVTLPGHGALGELAFIAARITGVLRHCVVCNGSRLVPFGR